MSYLLNMVMDGGGAMDGGTDIMNHQWTIIEENEKKEEHNMSDINWIQTKAGLQMAETIIRQLPRITICLEQLAKLDGTFKDIIKLADEMDVRKQENINLSHRVKELETMLKGYQPEYKDKFDNSILERMSRLETIIEERK